MWLTDLPGMFNWVIMTKLISESHSYGFSDSTDSLQIALLTISMSFDLSFSLSLKTLRKSLFKEGQIACESTVAPTELS